VLAAPASVLALVVLALNDHVLKEAWPGVVTGKLSDVAGLVVAPLLLAVLLAVIGLRRPAPWAVALTGVGFVLTKTSTAGAEVTSAVWSLTGVPTMIRSDPTDLWALPALGLAWWVDRSVRRAPIVPWRRTAALAAGAAVLPCAVLATAATSCDNGLGLTTVSRAEGDFQGRPRQAEQRLVLGEYSIPRYTIDSARTVAPADVDLVAPDAQIPEQCDPTDQDRCWRVRGDGLGVERSEDGGRTGAGARAHRRPGGSPEGGHRGRLR
jgi:xanthosine utilization system XapX-like protein